MHHCGNASTLRSTLDKFGRPTPKSLEIDGDAGRCSASVDLNDKEVVKDDAEKGVEENSGNAVQHSGVNMQMLASESDVERAPSSLDIEFEGPESATEKDEEPLAPIGDSGSASKGTDRRKRPRLCKVKRERLTKLANRLATTDDWELSPEMKGNDFLMSRLMSKVHQARASIKKSKPQVARSSTEATVDPMMNYMDNEVLATSPALWLYGSLWSCDTVRAPAAEWTTMTRRNWTVPKY